MQAAAKLQEAQKLGLRLDLWSYNTLIKGFCQANQVLVARDVLEAMKLQNLQPNVVRTYSQGRNVAGLISRSPWKALLSAVHALIWMHPYRWTFAGAHFFVQVTYTTLVDGCVRAGDLFLAEEMLRDMHLTGVPPNTVTFNIMLRGYCQWSDRPIQVCHPTALSLKMYACKIQPFIQRKP